MSVVTNTGTVGEVKTFVHSVKTICTVQINNFVIRLLVQYLTHVDQCLCRTKPFFSIHTSG